MEFCFRLYDAGVLHGASSLTSVSCPHLGLEPPPASSSSKMRSLSLLVDPAKTGSGVSPSLLFFMRVSSFILPLFRPLHSTVPHGQPSTPPEIQEGGGGEGGGLRRAAPFGPPRMVFLAFLAILTISTGMFLCGDGIVPLNHLLPTPISRCHRSLSHCVTTDPTPPPGEGGPKRQFLCSVLGGE